jgi:glycine/D-amino acid oxidase-like deaminating enzyme
MQTDAGENVSIWMATADVPLHAVLESDAQADVCIIGAGIAGLTVAYRMAGDGRSVVVLDDGPVGGGETSRWSRSTAGAARSSPPKAMPRQWMR